jgi:photosystem II stability/assembly factor-like uncharacterized protein
MNSGTKVRLNSISLVRTMQGGIFFVAGDSGVILYSETNGESWNQVSVPPEYREKSFNSVSFSIIDSGIVVGENGLILKLKKDVQGYTIDSIPVANPDPVKKSLRDMILLPHPAKPGFVVGDSGLIMRTTNRGATWLMYNSARIPANLNAFAFVALDRLYAVGDSATILKKATTVSVWNKINPPDEFLASKPNFNSMHFVNDTGIIVGANGAIAVSKNAGSIWNSRISHTTSALRGIFFGPRGINFYDYKVGWVVGDNGSILKTTDLGETWDQNESGTSISLRDVCFLSNDIGIIVGDSGTILRTTNGGIADPIFSATPRILPFGTIQTNTSKIGSIFVTNNGVRSLEIISVTSSNTAFTPLVTNASISMSEMQEIPIVYTPSGYYAEASTITIAGNFSGSPYTFLANGSGIDTVNSGWTSQNPVSSVATARDMEHISSSTILIPGEMGSIVQTTNRGLDWTVNRYAGGCLSQLNAIIFPSSLCGFVVGENGSIIKTTDGGITWEMQESRTTSSLVDVSFSDALNGFVVGRDPLLAGYSTIHRTTDGGVTWSTKYSNRDVTLNAISAINYNTAIAVGSTILRTTDGGITWNKLFGNYSYQDLTFIDQYVGIAVASDRVSRTTDKGLTWSTQGLSGNLLKIKFINESTGFIYGISEQFDPWMRIPLLEYISPKLGNIYQTNDGGISWGLVVSNSLDQVQAVSLVDNSIGMAVVFDSLRGAYKLMGCVNGIPTAKIPIEVPLQPLLSISFSNLNHGVSVGYGGTLVRTTNSGEKWNQLLLGTLLEYMRIPIGAAQCINDTIITAVGYDGSILRTSNGGMNWVNQKSGTSLSLTGIYFLDELNGYCVGSGGTILHTTNGGETWLREASPTQSTLTSILFTNPMNGIVVGYNGTIMQTTNGGIDWTPRQSGTDAYLTSLSFKGQNGIAVGSSGTILRSTNSGYSWASQFSATLDWLNGVSFTSDQVVTAVGDYGTILQSTDSGVSWSRQFSGTTTALVGICMLNDNVGTIVGDNGTILQTTTGGQRIKSSVSVSDFPKEFKLEQNYPNPFNPATKIQYDIPKITDVSLIVYDVIGREVARLVDEMKPPGHYEIVWDGSRLASGVYFYRLQTNNFIAVKKMLLVR